MSFTTSPAAPPATAAPPLTAADRCLPPQQEPREPTSVDTDETATDVLQQVTGDSQLAK